MVKQSPLWLRFFLLLGVAALAAGAGLFGYRYYTRPVTLTVAVGSIDGEAANAMSAMLSRRAGSLFGAGCTDNPRDAST